MTTSTTHETTIQEPFDDQVPRSLVERFDEAGLGSKRLIDVKDGVKVAQGEHVSYLPDSPQIDGNYGVYAGPNLSLGDSNWLLILDVDDYRDEDIHPDVRKTLDDLPPTLTVASPHTDGETGGHRYYAADSDPREAIKEATGGATNPKTAWGELRAENTYVVGPGSQLNGCGKEWCDECDEPDGGYYRIADDRPIAKITPDELAEIVRADPEYPKRRSSSQVRADHDVDLDDLDQHAPAEDEIGGLVESMRDLIRAFYDDDATTHYAQTYLIDLARGICKKRSFVADDGSGDRSEAELTLATFLFGVIRKYDEEISGFGSLDGDEYERAYRLIYAYITHACREHRTTKDHQVRKWIERPGDYRPATIASAVENYSWLTWRAWQHKKDEWDGEYSYLTLLWTSVSVRMLAQEDDPAEIGRGYPTNREVCELAQRIDPADHADGTYRQALMHLRDRGHTHRMAYLGGNDYRYYPSDFDDPDPENVVYVKEDGREWEPRARDTPEFWSWGEAAKAPDD